MKDTHKWSKSKKIMTVIDCILCLAIIVSAMLIVIDKSRIKNGVVYEGNSKETAVEKADGTTAPHKKGSTTARLMCAGDNLIHGSIYKQARSRADGNGYDFTYAYEQIEDIIKLSDLAFINQETIIDPESEPDTYPNFNSPTELLDHMIKIGFDVFNQSTNHVLDQGESGARRDLALFKTKQDIILTGLYENQEEMLKPQTTVVNGITFSFVGFTEYLNGYSLKADSDLGLLSVDDKRVSKEEHFAKMKQMIDSAKQASDIVCVSMHWATENILEPDESQEEIMAKLLEYGADLVIGTGPHVLQPIEYRQNGDGEQAAIIWSLGNLISCQSQPNQLLGGIADVIVKKDYEMGTTAVESVKLIPTVTMFNSGYSNVRIIPFRDFTEENASNHGISSSRVSCEYFGQFYNDMFGDKLEIDWTQQ